MAEPGDIELVAGRLPVLDADEAAELAGQGVLLDARAVERYRGETEPVDPRAGHIPGAVSAPTGDNLASDGTFRPTEQLRARFAALGADGGAPVGVYCGSGVTAAHQIVALTLAGIDATLFPGSWSAWSADPDRPAVAGGAPAMTKRKGPPDARTATDPLPLPTGTGPPHGLRRRGGRTHRPGRTRRGHRPADRPPRGRACPPRSATAARGAPGRRPGRPALAWYVAATTGLLPSSVLASPVDVVQQAVELTRTGELPDAIAASGRRAATGFVIGAAVALSAVARRRAVPAR